MRQELLFLVAGSFGLLIDPDSCAHKNRMVNFDPYWGYLRRPGDAEGFLLPAPENFFSIKL